MTKSNQGIFNSRKRKIVGILNVDQGDFSIEIKGETFNLLDLVEDYNGEDITITMEINK